MHFFLFYALQTWQFKPCHVRNALQTWQYKPCHVRNALRTWHFKTVTSVMLSKSLRTHYGRITDVTPHAHFRVPSRQFSSYVDEIRHGRPVPWFQQSCVFSTWSEYRIVSYPTFKSTITDVTSADTAYFCLFLA